MKMLILTLILALASISNCQAFEPDRSYLMSANGVYVDLPKKSDDYSNVLIAKAHPSAMPSNKKDEITVVAHDVAKDGEVQVKAKLCYEDGTGCMDLEVK